MKKTGRLLALSAAAICSLGVMTSCNKTGFKVGLLCLHGQTSTYDNNFIEAFEKACKKNNLKEGTGYEIRTDVKEDYNDIYTAAKEWAEDGYSMVFADSFGHQEGLIQVAKEYPDTEFCHATGTTALLNVEEGLKLNNYHNAFANIYKGRYLAGVAAGAKMVEDITATKPKYNVEDAKIGYVGAWPYAEVISGYTSFYLGACSVFREYKDNEKIHNVLPTMTVKYTYSWYDYGAEKEAAFELIRKYGCKMISQHADSMGAPQACALEGIPNVCYNISTKKKTPNTYLYGSKIDWTPYFDYIIKEAKKKYDGGSAHITTDYVGDYTIDTTESVENGMVRTLDFGKIATDFVQDAVADAKVDLTQNDLHVFDCNNFTVTKKFYGEDDPRNRNPFANIGVYNSSKEGGIDWFSSCEGQKIEVYKANVEDRNDFFAPDRIVSKPRTEGQTDYYIDESAYAMPADPTQGEFPTSITDDSFRSAPFFELIIDGITTLN